MEDFHVKCNRSFHYPYGKPDPVAIDRFMQERWSISFPRFLRLSWEKKRSSDAPKRKSSRKNKKAGKEVPAFFISYA